MATDYLRMLSEKVTVPIVYLDFYLDDIKEDSVISNSFYGTYQITHYLLQKGHRQIAFVGTLFSTKSITDRYLGYEKAMMEMGLEVKRSGSYRTEAAPEIPWRSFLFRPSFPLRLYATVT